MVSTHKNFWKVAQIWTCYRLYPFFVDDFIDFYNLTIWRGSSTTLTGLFEGVRALVYGPWGEFEDCFKHLSRTEYYTRCLEWSNLKWQDGDQEISCYMQIRHRSSSITYLISNVQYICLWPAISKNGITSKTRCFTLVYIGICGHQILLCTSPNSIVSKQWIFGILLLWFILGSLAIQELSYRASPRKTLNFVKLVSDSVKKLF